jgi:hypothetical protein
MVYNNIIKIYPKAGKRKCLKPVNIAGGSTIRGMSVLQDTRSCLSVMPGSENAASVFADSEAQEHGSASQKRSAAEMRILALYAAMKLKEYFSALEN